MRSVGLGHDIEVVSTDLIAGSRTYRYGVAGDRGQGLGQEALLDGAGGIEILGQTGVIEMAFMIDGVLNRDCSLQDETLQKIAFIET
jgi:hypothetical protein